MKPGEHLVDIKRGKTPYRIAGSVASGEHYQLAEIYDEEQEREIVARAILYGDEASSDAGATSRRSELKRQWRFLKAVADSEVAPEPVAWLELEDSPIDKAPEPILLCEKVDGPRLYDWLVDKYPQGLEVERALGLIAESVDFLAEMHDQRWLWRDFDPRKLRLENEERIRPVSVDGVIEVGEPVSAEDRPCNADYVAPELRGDVALNMQRPAGDLYGLGALLSFLLSGEEPRHRVESPLSYDAYKRIEERDVPGVQLLLAKLLQPMADKRLSTVEESRRYFDIDSLPTRKEPGFEKCELPAPWLGLDIDNPEENRGLRSNLSAGPLVSMPHNTGEAAVEEKAQAELDWRIVAAVVAVALAVVVMGILMVG